MVETALSSVGITKERVERWLGPECGCDERQQKLNAIGEWATRVVRGRVNGARNFLESIMGEGAVGPVPRRNECRSCGGTDLSFLFGIGEQYVSDFTPDPIPSPEAVRAPLDLVLCNECSLVQNPWTAPQELLYARHYWYRSGVTQTMRESLAGLTRTLYDRHHPPDGSIVLDIGSNDGTLLRSWPGRLVRVGCEPATNLQEEGARGIQHLIRDFWSTGAWTREMGDAKAAVVTACGMMYDLDDPNPFVAAVADVLDDHGVFVFQLMGARGMLDLCDVGNLAHEHLEFYTLRSLEILLRRHGLTIFDLEINDVNGSSYRISASKDRRLEHWRVPLARRHEEREGMLTDRAYLAFFEKAERNKRWILETLDNHLDTWVYGASTKGNVILQWLGLTGQNIAAAVDKSPEKWGRYTVGTGIPIRSHDDFHEADPDLALVLPYAFLPEFVQLERRWLDGGGRFVVPFPEARFA